MSKEQVEDKWIYYVDKSGNFKTHIIPLKMAGNFLTNFMSVGMDPEETKRSSSINFETNGGYGPIINSYPKMSFQLGVRTLILDTNKVAETGKSLVTNKEQSLPTGEKYHVLYERFSVLILPSDEVKLLIPLLVAKLDESREISRDFMKQFSSNWNASAIEYKKKYGTSIPYQFVPVAKDSA